MSDQVVGSIGRLEAGVRGAASSRLVLPRAGRREPSTLGADDPSAPAHVENVATRVEFQLNRKTGRILLSLRDRGTDAVLRSVPLVMAGFGPDDSQRGALVDAKA